MKKLLLLLAASLLMNAPLQAEQQKLTPKEYQRKVLWLRLYCARDLALSAAGMIGGVMLGTKTMPAAGFLCGVGLTHSPDGSSSPNPITCSIALACIAAPLCIAGFGFNYFFNALDTYSAQKWKLDNALKQSEKAKNKQQSQEEQI